MLQKDKVAIMTRLAIEEKNEPRFSYITRSYWFNDYLTTEMWKAFFAITMTFGLTVLLGLVAYGDSWTKYHIAEVIALGTRLLTVYLCIVILGILICALSHVWLYKQAYRKQERIKAELRKLNRIYALEEAWENMNRQETQDKDESF